MDNQAQQPLGEPAPWFLISPPQAAKGTIQRERLFNLVDAAAEHERFTIVAAPSGYGKTVLLAEWARRHSASTAWLTLTHHDQGNERLVLAGVLSALHRRTTLVESDPGQLSIAPDSSARSLIGRIAELVETSGASLSIVIDDAHFAGATLVENITVLSSLTDGKLRFVLCGKPELASWFSGPIAAQATHVLSAGDLAFTVDEALSGLSGDEPTSANETVADLIRATGGWPIAVHLHRLTHSIPPAPGESDRLLADYIARTVLSRLNPQLADFILATSVCNRLTPVLARALSGNDDAESQLEECVAQGLFLTCFIDVDGAKIYRWHDEFAARCRDILARTAGARYRSLDATAARCLAPFFPAEAVLHAMRADMPDLAYEIIRSSWIRVLIDSRAKELNAQCLALPQRLAAHPEILLIRACCLNQLGDTMGAQQLVHQADLAGPHSPEFVVTRAFASLFWEDDPNALAAAVDTARASLEDRSLPQVTHAHGLFLVGWTELRLRRAPQEAVQLLEAALREANDAHQTILARRASSNLLLALSYSGNFAGARALIADERSRSDGREEWHYYDGGIELFAEGFADYWQNRIEDAEASFLALAATGGHDSSYAALARVYLAFCAAITGSPARLRRAHADTSAISGEQTHGVPWPSYQAIARAELFAAAGDFDRALATIEPIRGQQNIPIVRAMTADLMRRAGRLGDAAQTLAALPNAELAPSYLTAATHVTAALIAHERGDTTRAHRLFERALDAAAAESVIRPFVSNDERLQTLLVQHAAVGTAHEDFVASRIASQRSVPGQGHALGSLLSAREREIYGYLCTTMTAIEIGEKLFVSVNTIRTHQRAIYRKLGVTNRRDAIRLGL